MSQNAFSAIAVIAALTFLAMALTACANSEQPVPAVAAEHYYKGSGVGEFHGADIGGDALRGELPAE